MAEIVAGASPTPEQIIVAREQARGLQQWTGPTGAADAFALMGLTWNVNAYSVLTSLYTTAYNLERIG